MYFIRFNLISAQTFTANIALLNAHVRKWVVCGSVGNIDALLGYPLSAKSIGF